MNIVFFATSDFALPSLNEINKSNHKILSVVTSKGKPFGRGQKLKKSPVFEHSKSLHLPIIEVGRLNDIDFINRLKLFNPDIFVVLGSKPYPKSIAKCLISLRTWNVKDQIIPIQINLPKKEDKKELVCS